MVLCGTKKVSSMTSLEEPFEAHLFLRVQNSLLYKYVAYIEMWPWTTKPVISHTGIFVAIEKITLYG